MKSWKIGAIAGLIAGIVLGIIYEIFNQIVLSLGFFSPFWHPIVIDNIVVNIPLFGLWGIVLGIIFSKVYNIIPTKGVLKGLIYGLFIYFILIFRIETIDLAYGLILDVVGWNLAGFFSWLSFGLLLGILYNELLNGEQYPIRERKIKTYDMRSGILPGAIAGIMQGIAAGFVSVIGHVTGYWGIPVASGELVSTIEFWWSQFGTHTLFNMIWGTVFGAFFALVYYLVPGKKVTKGLCFALIMFFITTFQICAMCVAWSANHDAWEIASIFTSNIFVYGCDFVVFGLVLGAIYKPPK